MQNSQFFNVDINLANCIIALFVLILVGLARRFRKLHYKHEKLKKAHSLLSLQLEKSISNNNLNEVEAVRMVEVVSRDSPVVMRVTKPLKPPLAPSLKTSFSKIFTEGLPSIPTKNNSFTLTSKSKITFIQRDLQILSDIKSFNHTEETDSVLLLTIGNFQKLRFVSEVDITDLVKTLLSDVLSAAQLNHKVYLYQETASQITSFRYDLYTIRHSDKNVPVGILIIKEPSVGVTSNMAVLEDLYEDIVYYRCLYGVKELFAVVTTYDEWNICWLSDCNSCAASASEEAEKNREESPDESYNSVLLNKNNDSFNDVLYGTGTIRYNNPILVPTLITALRKMYCATVSPPPLISSNRICIQIKPHKNWQCARLPDSIKTMSLCPVVEKGTIPSTAAAKEEQQECFYLLRDYRGGRDGRVWLGCDAYGRLAVIKFTTDEEVLQQECSNWNDVYGDAYEEEEEEESAETEGGSVSVGAGIALDSPAVEESKPPTLVYVTTLLGMSALIMPVAFHCVESVLDSREIFFDVALHNWSFELSDKQHDQSHLDDHSADTHPTAVTDQEDVHCVAGLKECIAMIDQHSQGKFSPHNVALAAIDYIAKCHFVHEDVEYRHVALLPIVRNKKRKAGSSQQLEKESGSADLDITLFPIMIDLSSMTQGVKFKPAKEAMLKKLNEVQFDTGA